MKSYQVKGTTDEVTTCELCGRDELKGTVVLVPLDADGNPDGDACYFGTSCAAKAAGWTQREVTRQVTSVKRAAKKEVAAASRIAAMKAWEDETRAYEKWLKETYPTGSPVKEFGVARLWAQFRASETEKQTAESSPVVDVPAEKTEPIADPAPAEPLEIEPRGTVYGTRTHRQWSRVINGTVFRFELFGPSDYWRKGPTVRVTRHPYGRYPESSAFHESAEMTAYVDGMQDTSPCTGDRGHFVGRCGACDAWRMTRMNRGQVEDLYRQGVFSQMKFEAYMYAWATSAVRHTAGEWAEEPTDPRVTEIVAAIRRHAGIVN